MQKKIIETKEFVLNYKNLKIKLCCKLLQELKANETEPAVEKEISQPYSLFSLFSWCI